MGRPRDEEAKSSPSINATSPHHFPVTQRTDYSHDVLGTGYTQQQVQGTLEDWFDAIKIPAFESCSRITRNIYHAMAAEVCCSQEEKSLSMLCQALLRAIVDSLCPFLPLQKSTESCQGIHEKLASVTARVTPSLESST